MIKIIAVGNLKERYLKEAQKEYTKRLTKYTKVEIIEIKETNKKDETKEIISKLNKNDYNILLDINAQQLTSIEFSQQIEKINTYHSSNIIFIVGGSNGVEEEIKEYINNELSFSKMTFPHQLFRINLLEQIYRAYKIINNEPYHK